MLPARGAVKPAWDDDDWETVRGSALRAVLIHLQTYSREEAAAGPSDTARNMKLWSDACVAPPSVLDSR